MDRWRGQHAKRRVRDHRRASPVGLQADRVRERRMEGENGQAAASAQTGERAEGLSTHAADGTAW